MSGTEAKIKAAVDTGIDRAYALGYEVGVEAAAQFVHDKAVEFGNAADSEWDQKDFVSSGTHEAKSEMLHELAAAIRALTAAPVDDPL